MNEVPPIYLNVGGCVYVTRRSTLANGSSTFFSALMRATDIKCVELFVDRDPAHFRHVLNWLRGVRYLPEDEATLLELQWEADYYCMQDLHNAIACRERFSVPRTLHDMCGEIRQRR